MGSSVTQKKILVTVTTLKSFFCCKLQILQKITTHIGEVRNVVIYPAAALPRKNASHQLFLPR